MPWTRNGSIGSGATDVAQLTYTLTTTREIKQGDLIVLAVTKGSTTPKISSCTDNGPGLQWLLQRQYLNSPNQINLLTAYATSAVPSGKVITVTWSSSTGDDNMIFGASFGGALPGFQRTPIVVSPLTEPITAPAAQGPEWLCVEVAYTQNGNPPTLNPLAECTVDFVESNASLPCSGALVSRISTAAGATQTGGEWSTATFERSQAIGIGFSLEPAPLLADLHRGLGPGMLRFLPPFEQEPPPVEAPVGSAPAELEPQAAPLLMGAAAEATAPQLLEPAAAPLVIGGAATVTAIKPVELEPAVAAIIFGGTALATAAQKLQLAAAPLQTSATATATAAQLLQTAVAPLVSGAAVTLTAAQLLAPAAAPLLFSGAATATARQLLNLAAAPLLFGASVEARTGIQLTPQSAPLLFGDAATETVRQLLQPAAAPLLFGASNEVSAGGPGALIPGVANLVMGAAATLTVPQLLTPATAPILSGDAASLHVPQLLNVAAAPLLMGDSLALHVRQLLSPAPAPLSFGAAAQLRAAIQLVLQASALLTNANLIELNAGVHIPDTRLPTHAVVQAAREAAVVQVYAAAVLLVAYRAAATAATPGASSAHPATPGASKASVEDRAHSSVTGTPYDAEPRVR